MIEDVRYHPTYGTVTVELILPDGETAWVLISDDVAVKIRLDELTLPLEGVA